MPRLPKIWTATDGGQDNNNWGQLLVEFLQVTHNADGTLSTSVTWPAGSGPILTAPDGTRYRLTVDDNGALLTQAL